MALPDQLIHGDLLVTLATGWPSSSCKATTAGKDDAKASKKAFKFFHKGIELKRPICFEEHCIWIRGTAVNRTLVSSFLKLPAASSSDTRLLGGNPRPSHKPQHRAANAVDAVELFNLQPVGIAGSQVRFRKVASCMGGTAGAGVGECVWSRTGRAVHW